MSYIHQIWLQGKDGLPDKYKTHSENYDKINDKYILWSDDMIRKLIETDYPEVMETYLSYDFWVMRVDLAKYLILDKYGGYYVDMDTKPIKSFSGMCDDKPSFYSKDVGSLPQLFVGDVFLNNNFLYSPHPKHPLFKLFIEYAIKSKNRMFYDLKIYYILNSVGPIFMMNVIDQYKLEGGKVDIMTEQYVERYFKDEEAKTWLSSQWFDTRDKLILVFILCLFLIAVIILWKK